VFSNWKTNNEYHDVTVINTDATGAEYDRWILSGCECAMFKEALYAAATPEYFSYTVRITCPTDPVHLYA
jgi:hypothetical protein